MFRNNNKTVWSEAQGPLYIVYSYGDHFPIYVYDHAAGMWFGNDDKYSPTTSRHQTYARPRLAQPYPACTSHTNDITWVAAGELRDLVHAGSYAAYAGNRCTQKEQVAYAC
jgi:hypothetical protein